MVLSSTPQGGQSFASYLSNGDTTWATADNGTAWQEGNATFASGANSLTFIIDSDFRSSNSNLAVNFSTGGVEVFCDLISLRAKVLERLLWAAAAITPPVNDGTALGVSGTAFSDLFLAVGAVIDWGAGDVLATHSSNALAFTGASSGYSFDALLNLSGAAAGQISFPATQNASAGANTLDDYEEGTCTITITFGGAAVGVTYAANTLTYTKAGRLVHLHGGFALSNKGSSTGPAQLSGLPFPPNIAGSFACVPVHALSMNTITADPAFQITHNATTIALRAQLADADLDNTHFQNGTILRPSFSYSCL